MGMIVEVYRNGAISTLNKIQTSRACVVNVDGPFEPSADMPAVLLVRGNLPGTAKVVPVGHENLWFMFGGAYIATSDSRFSRAVENITGAPFYGAVPLHDRSE